MSSQTTLTENAPMILDATCSFRTKTRWPRFATIRIDVRPETRPDLIMDARELKFPDSYFEIIYCDPPHLFPTLPISPKIEQFRRLHPQVGKYTMFTHYGYWKSRDEWLDFAQKSTKEFYRCLKPNGLLHYKLTESRKMKPEDVLGLGLFELVKHITTKSDGLGKRGEKATSIVHWLTMRPKS